MVKINSYYFKFKKNWVCTNYIHFKLPLEDKIMEKKKRNAEQITQILLIIFLYKIFQIWYPKYLCQFQLHQKCFLYDK